MRRQDFSYAIPERLIAQFPLPDREQARLLVVDRRLQKISHDIFANIGTYLPSQSVIVLNDSKVIPARLLGTKERSGGKVEIFLLKKLPDGFSYEVLLRPAKKIRNGDRVRFAGSAVTADVVDVAKRIVRFNRKRLTPFLNKTGHMPLPPYIKREDDRHDAEFYQTVYAKEPGSVAAPTAGLHFTKPLLERLKRQGHRIAKVTLHVNYATFKPVEADDITQHPMHAEDYSVSATTMRVVKNARAAGQRIVAVGTTSCRALETTAQTGKVKGSTDLFIYPGYEFRLVDVLITNFHLPFSTLLMLVYAFGSTALMKKAYQEAIENEYRFFSYGDAMVIV